MAAKEAKDSGAVRGKSHKGRWIGLAILFVIIVAGAYFYETYGGLVSSLITVLSAGKQINSSTLQSVMFQKIDALKAFSTNYTGTIVINQDPAMGFSYAKYYNDTRVTFYAYNLSRLGNVSAVFVTKNTSAYGTLCIKASPGSPFNITSGGNITNGYRCVQTQSRSVQAQLLGMARVFIDLSSLGNVVPKSYSLSSYNGQPCYSVSGTGTVNVNSTLLNASAAGYTPVNVSFSACFSGQYNIPLYVHASMISKRGGSMIVSLNETSISQATTAAQVTAPP